MRIRHQAARHNPAGTLGNAACIAGSVISLPVTLGALAAVAIGERLQGRFPAPLLRLTTWRKRRAWKREHVPEDPFPMSDLTPYEHLVIADYEGRSQ